MVVLGVDPGTATTGFALIDFHGTKQELVDFGVIQTEKSESSEHRLLQIFNDLSILVEEKAVAEMALESVFFNTNVKTAILVSQASGVVKLIAAQNKIPIFEYTPLQVKIALTGYGRAEKPQVGQMVRQVFGLKSVPKPDDAADAVAITLCHCYSRKLRSLQR